MSKQETKVQTKIIKYLEREGHEVINVIIAGKAGHSDLICCAPNGKFFAVEVKDRDKPKALQEYRLQEYRKRGGVGIWCYDYKDFTVKYEEVRAELT